MADSVRLRSRVLGFNEPPGRHDVVVDLRGAFVLPGLVNAHDHLELNHYGHQKRRECYDNASVWIDDMRMSIRSDTTIRKNQAYPLADRLFIGALKNLLSGVTTVAHHNPWYRPLRHLPITVVRRYGWAHSLALESEPVGAGGEPGGRVRDRCARTPASTPFIVHAGEGVDQTAAREFARLEETGCLRPNTVLVHGVAFTGETWTRLRSAGAGLVWCPASNHFLFGRTVCAREFLDASDGARRHLALGTDSRLTGAEDLLGEMKAAAAASSVSASELLSMVTEVPAMLLRLRDAGRLQVGYPADLVVVAGKGGSLDDAATALLAAKRQDVLLVVVRGKPLIAAPELASVFTATGTRPVSLVVDGVRRLARPKLARMIARCPIVEPGVECVT
jgi:cytosine/adenosine deaminase-related metal-dependent hydrolase